MTEYGVYISNNAEIVTTEKYAIAFRRVKSQDALESCLLEKDDRISRYFCLGVCRSLPATTIPYPRPQKWQFAFKSARKRYYNHKSLAGWLGTANPIIQQNEDRIDLTFPDGDHYSARQIESFSMDELSPQPLTVNKDNIGDCLKYWHIGCHEEIIETNAKDSCRSVSINTREHMYTFQMLPNNFYCRAARYHTCNSGVVFNQSFRQKK
jgi:hypothetical protein